MRTSLASFSLLLLFSESRDDEHVHRWATEQHESEGVPGGDEDDDPDLQLALAMSMSAAADAPRGEPSAAPPSSQLPPSPPLPFLCMRSPRAVTSYRQVLSISDGEYGRLLFLLYFPTDISTQFCVKSLAITLDPQKCHACTDVCHYVTRMKIASCMTLTA